MITTILTDIEGTTSSLSFVKEVLFPYARERLPAFVVTHADTPEVQFWLHEAAEEADLVSASQQEIIELLINWIDLDRKSPALKALQGMIWEEGYRNREFRAHLYPEVAARLRAWQADGKKLYVYSSGSVQAQELFFGYSDAGDISALFSGFFDTTTGSKLAADSYTKISEAIGVPAAQILFLSDVIAELDAARSAGMRTTQLARAPATCPFAASHPCVADFDGVTA